MRPGLPAKATHDYRRNGTTLFAALEVATGEVTDQCYARHSRAEFLDFLNEVARAHPRRELHIIVDDYHTHQHDDIDQWLAEHPRTTLHSTPTSGSWLNLVEVFFGVITRQAIRRGSFDSVSQLVTAISAFIDGRNDRCHPFTWTETADEILPHATRRRDSDAGHQFATDPEVVAKVTDIVGLHLARRRTRGLVRPRLPPPRHHDTVRRAEHRHRQGHRPLPTPAPATRGSVC